MTPLSQARNQHYYSYLLLSNDETSLWAVRLFVQYCFERFSCEKEVFVFFLNNEHVISPQELLEPLEDKVASSELLEITKD